jgi:ribosomal-protein-serine acetyltransferase
VITRSCSDDERWTMTTFIPAPMFSHRLTDDAVLVLRTAAIADAYHELVVANLARLARWEPWAVTQPTPEGTRSFLETAGRSWLDGSELPVAVAVRSDDRWCLVGSVGLRIDRYRRMGEVGYWIDEAHEGRGLMRKAVAAVLDEAFGPLALDKVTLHTDVDNERSRSLARRLGFVEEGLLRQALAFPDGRRDQVAHGLLAAEWASRSDQLRRPGGVTAP